MAYGFEVRNDSSIVQIDSDFSNMYVVNKYVATIPAAGTQPPLPISVPANYSGPYFIGIRPTSSNINLNFFSLPTNPYGYTGTNYLFTTWRSTAVPITVFPHSLTVDVVVVGFSQTNIASATGYGLNVYRQDGVLAYTSNMDTGGVAALLTFPTANTANDDTTFTAAIPVPLTNGKKRYYCAEVTWDNFGRKVNTTSTYAAFRYCNFPNEDSFVLYNVVNEYTSGVRTRTPFDKRILIMDF